ncbi:MAG: N-acetylgalactosamine 6-sulfate sulfatase [Chlamydiae bacterium]|nr:MAG: N-acetylgalactosamine 6-sulfate sulfatase [Chlamydiota bacterium]
MKNKKTYDRRNFIKTIGKCAAASLFASPLLALSKINKKRKPNIIFILADDMGWMDSTPYGSRFYETPNIEKLAKMGMRFTSAYAANPLCSPTRASIITGQYPCRIGLTTPACHVDTVRTNTFLQTSAPPTSKRLEPVTKTRLQLEYYTTGEALKSVGYATALFGKWHLGWKPFEPPNQGFDVNEPGGSYPGPPSYFSPYHMERSGFKDGPKGEQIDERLTESAISFMKKNVKKDKPFFLNFWNFDVHAPYQGKEKLINKYEKKIEIDDAQNCPTMGSMIETLDNCVGEILDNVKKLGIENETIIIFFSDNGGNMYDTVNGTTPTSNYPLRGGKATIYEGGTRVPMIVVWPGVVKPDTVSDVMISSVDFYPTILDMAGVKPKPNQIIDGIDLVSFLKGKSKKVHEEIFCHFPHTVSATKNIASTSVRKGDWKLIKFYADNSDQTDRYELYNLKKDIGEKNNLAKKYPEIVRKLDKLIVRHLKKTNAIVPIANPKYDPDYVQPPPVISKPVHGWQAQHSCELHAADGQLEVKVTGADPYFVTKNVPQCTGPIKLHFQMKADVGGDGRIYWNTKEDKSFLGNFESFALNHDKQWHEYIVDLPKIPRKQNLNEIRIDPGDNPGNGENTALFDWIRIETPTGKLLKEWKF